MVRKVCEAFQSRRSGVSMAEQADAIDDHGMLVKSRILRKDPPSVFVVRCSVFFHQGDWMAGSYGEVSHFEYGEDWGRANFPASHALQVTPETFVEAKLAVGEFITSRDVAQTTRDRVKAYG